MNRSVQTLVTAVIIAGGAVFLAGLTQATTDDLKALVVLIALGALAERHAVGLFSAWVSVGAVTVLIAAIIAGVWGVVLVAPAIALAGDARTPAEWYKRAFNMGVYLLSGTAFWACFSLFDQPATPDGWPAVIIPAVVGAGANYAVNTGLVALVTARQRGEAFVPTFRKTFGWLAPQYLIVGLAAVAAGTGYYILGLWAFAVFAAPVAGIRHAYSLGVVPIAAREDAPKAA